MFGLFKSKDNRLDLLTKLSIPAAEHIFCIQQSVYESLRNTGAPIVNRNFWLDEFILGVLGGLVASDIVAAGLAQDDGAFNMAVMIALGRLGEKNIGIRRTGEHVTPKSGDITSIEIFNKVVALNRAANHARYRLGFLRADKLSCFLAGRERNYVEDQDFIDVRNDLIEHQEKYESTLAHSTAEERVTAVFLSKKIIGEVLETYKKEL